MTDSTPFFRERAAEIIAAYGADAARWPDAERATALTVIAADPALTAARRDAAALDALLGDWARAPVAGADSIAAAATITRRRPGIGRWAAGGSIAAVLALGIMVVRPVPTPVATTTVAAVTDEQAFAGLFTPNPDEENFL